MGSVGWQGWRSEVRGGWMDEAIENKHWNIKLLIIPFCIQCINMLYSRMNRIKLNQKFLTCKIYTHTHTHVVMQNLIWYNLI